MTIDTIIRAYLLANGYDGLYNSEVGCGCDLDDLFPCDQPNQDCSVGYRVPCPKLNKDYNEERDGDCECDVSEQRGEKSFHISATKGGSSNG